MKKDTLPEYDLRPLKRQIAHATDLACALGYNKEQFLETARDVWNGKNQCCLFYQLL